jgi:hypothetical protein
LGWSIAPEAVVSSDLDEVKRTLEASDRCLAFLHDLLVVERAMWQFSMDTNQIVDETGLLNNEI